VRQYAVLLTSCCSSPGWTLCDRQVWSRRRRQARRGRLAFAVLVAPVAAVNRRAAGARAVAPGRPGGKALAGAERYVRVAWPQLVRSPAFTCPDNGHRAYFVGTLKLLLCLAAIAVARSA